MSLILGILDSGGVAGGGTSYESIATVTVGSGGAASATFSSIPATYTHLQVRVLQKAAGAGDLNFTFNSDSGSNYSRHYLGSNGSSAFSGGSVSESSGYVGYNPSSTYFQASVIDVLDYANSNKYKTVRSLLGTDANGSGAIYYTSSLWLSTSAVTNISFTSGGGNFSQYTSFALYGIKGS